MIISLTGLSPILLIMLCASAFAQAPSLQAGTRGGVILITPFVGSKAKDSVLTMPTPVRKASVVGVYMQYIKNDPRNSYHRKKSYEGTALDFKSIESDTLIVKKLKDGKHVRTDQHGNQTMMLIKGPIYCEFLVRNGRNLSKSTETTCEIKSTPYGIAAAKRNEKISAKYFFSDKCSFSTLTCAQIDFKQKTVRAPTAKEVKSVIQDYFGVKSAEVDEVTMLLEHERKKMRNRNISDPNFEKNAGVHNTDLKKSGSSSNQIETETEAASKVNSAQ